MRHCITRLFQRLGTTPLPNEPVVALRKWQ